MSDRSSPIGCTHISIYIFLFRLYTILKTHVNIFITLPPGELQTIVMMVCLSCLSLGWHNSKTAYMAELHQFLCILPVAVARSSSDRVAIRYVAYFRFYG